MKCDVAPLGDFYRANVACISKAEIHYAGIYSVRIGQPEEPAKIIYDGQFCNGNTT